MPATTTANARHARCPTCHRPLKRSNLQNSAYWALLHLIAEKIQPSGHSYSADTWHEYLKSKYLGADDIKLPNGKTLTITHSTGDLDAEEFSRYLTQVESWAATHGVYLEERR